MIPPAPGARKGSFADFLAELLAFESGIDPRRFEYYLEHYDARVLSAPRVRSPGRALRDPRTGELVMGPMTVREYFESIGVAHLFDARDPACLRAMQYRAINALGFVGYQLGEAALIDCGYYQAERAVRAGEEYARYYFGGVPASTWREGQCEAFFRIAGASRDIVATDVNSWRGIFTGKDGVTSFAALCVPEKQDLVLRNLFRANHACIRDQLARGGATLDARPARGWTLSGLLAAAHLAGPYAVAQFLRSGADAADEAGTPLSQYLAQFSGYETPFESC